jgi:hypothetical protein
VGSIKQSTEAMHQGQEAGPAKPPGAAAPPRPTAPAQLGQTSHRTSVTTASNPDRRSEVGSIQRTKLASLGSMDSQTSDQPNGQHFIYTKEHALVCIHEGLGPAAPRDPATPPSCSKPTHNRLLTASGTKSQMLNQRW